MALAPYQPQPQVVGPGHPIKSWLIHTDPHFLYMHRVPIQTNIYQPWYLVPTPSPIENKHPKNSNPTWVFLVVFSKPPRCVAKPKCSNKNAAPNLRGVQRQVESGTIFPYRKGLSSFCHVGDMHKYNICMCIYFFQSCINNVRNCGSVPT